MTLPPDSKQLWEESFSEQIARGAYNTAPVEAVVRTVSYFLRDRYKGEELRQLHFLEMGCGAGPNLVWLAQKGIRASGVDIARNALALAQKNLERAGLADRTGSLLESSVARTSFADAAFDGIIEACVFQHLTRDDRVAAFGEVRRLLKPGGVFVGYMLDVGHTIYQMRREEERREDPGTLYLAEGGSRVYLSNIGLTHFFAKEELLTLLSDFSVADPCLSSYYLPKEEARRRGYDEYLQSMWTVYAVR